MSVCTDCKAWACGFQIVFSNGVTACRFRLRQALRLLSRQPCLTSWGTCAGNVSLFHSPKVGLNPVLCFGALALGIRFRGINTWNPTPAPPPPNHCCLVTVHGCFWLHGRRNYGDLQKFKLPLPQFQVFKEMEISRNSNSPSPNSNFLRKCRSPEN